MNSGTRRRDVVFTRLGALVIAGFETWAGGVRTAMLVGVADGPDRAGSVTVEEEGFAWPSWWRLWASATSVRLHPHSRPRQTRVPSHPRGSERHTHDRVSHEDTLASRRADDGYSRPGQFDGDQRGAARVGESLR